MNQLDLTRRRRAHRRIACMTAMVAVSALLAGCGTARQHPSCQICARR